MPLIALNNCFIIKLLREDKVYFICRKIKFCLSVCRKIEYSRKNSSIMQWLKSSRSFLGVLLKWSFKHFRKRDFVPFLLYLFRCSWPMCRLIILTASWFSASTAISYALFFSRLSSFRLISPLNTKFNFNLFYDCKQKKGTHASKTSIKSKFADLTAKWSKLSRPVPYSKFNFAPAAIKLFVHSSRFDIAAEI